MGYYRWRVVLAACSGVMAGFGSLFVGMVSAEHSSAGSGQ